MTNYRKRESNESILLINTVHKTSFLLFLVTSPTFSQAKNFHNLYLFCVLYAFSLNPK